MKQPLALIIVDTLDIASLDFRQTLDLAGYLTELIVCDQVCLPQISRAKPNVIFLYLSLSNTPQIKFLEKLREDDGLRNIPIIALLPDDKDTQRLQSLVSIFLVRPISRDSLLGLLSSLDYVDKFADKTPWDALTGLYNPTFFLARLNKAIELSQRFEENEFSVFSINLDQIMEYEKKFGKEYRQHLLQGIVKVLKKVLRPDDIVAGFDSNLFMVLINNTVDRFAPVSIIDRMQFEFDEFLVSEGLKNRIKIDIGMMCCVSQYKSANEMLTDARFALKMAGQAKRRNYDICERKTIPNQQSGIRSLAGV